jgi:hypothetical protein
VPARPPLSAAALTGGLLALLAVTACVPPPPPASNETPTTAAPATTAAATTTAATSPPGSFTCPTWTATSANTAADNRIQEASGIAASRVNRALWWVHNDGPNAPGQVVSPTLYGLNASGATVSTIDLSGATDIDWEDMDEVTIGGVSTIWVADVGDNPKARPSVQLYRFVEPVVPAGQGVAVTPDVINLTYPGGAKHNVETSFVDPTNGDYYLVTKEIPPLVFRIPAASLVAGATVALTAPIATLDALDHSTDPAGKPTGGDLSNDGSLLAIKTLDRTFMWHRSPGQTIQAMLKAKPAGDCIYDDVANVQQRMTPKLPDLGHGEAIAFTADGHQLATIAEGGRIPLRIFRAP